MPRGISCREWEKKRKKRKKPIPFPCCARPTVSSLLFVLSFALLGDAPYSHAQVHLLDDVIERMNAEPLAFAVHVGDITSGQGPCDDEWLEARKRQFAKIKHPFVLLPGDNEWTDCHRGGFEPAERLRKWRDLFCLQISLPEFKRQKGPYCENVRWVSDNVIFAGLNIPGSNNNLARDPAEYGERMQAVFAWLDEAVALARKRDGLVVLMHANPFIKRPAGRDGYSEVRERLQKIAAAMPGKVLLVHGDTHFFQDDEPMPGLRRVEVFGSPAVRWVRGWTKPFRVEPQPP